MNTVRNIFAWIYDFLLYFNLQFVGYGSFYENKPNFISTFMLDFEQNNLHVAEQRNLESDVKFL